MNVLKREKQKLSVKWKVILLALFSTLIPLVIIGPFTFLYLNKVVENKVSETTSNLLSVLDWNINTFVIDVENISNTIFSSNDIRSYLSYNKLSPRLYMLETESRNVLNNITIVNKPYINAVYIGNEHHEFLKVNRGESNYTSNIYEQIQNASWYNGLKQSEWGGVWFKGSEVNFVKGSANSLMFGRVIRDIGTSEEIGITIISVDQLVFDNMFKDIQTDGTILIADGDSTIYFSGNEKQLTTKELSSLLKNYGDQGTIIETIHGTKYVLNFHTNFNTNWKIVSIIPYQSIVKEVNTIRIITASLLVLSLLLATFSALLIAKKITKQLALLRNVTQKMENREYISSIQFDAKDDIGKIGNRVVQLYNRNNKLTAQLYEAQLKEKEAELLALQSHINPHFLYNTLNSIFWMAEKAKAKPISQMALSLSQLFKLTLNNGDPITAVRNEIEQVKSYLQIQNIRFDNKIEYSINIDPSILDKKIIKLLLQPIVENAVQHGLEPKKGQGKIVIRGVKKEKMMVFEIIDNGIGFNREEIIKKDQGYALKNIHERIKLHYGSEYGLSIESEVNKGTKVVLTVGLEKDKCK
ncbi:cache domain-containing sensor histidine kinase [Bacillus taeanensis]|uniref:Histidine kinase/HSP90-like ATPase domain-containing protein n=1 Tax=Bacillus taeanensis TaxID=273032 RepID=A0A366XY05_9BACI|nr:sensor histidine kinase [Bacillus taeanensis]RBW70777.1 hypothetical protein DS031_04675 [Bacillus taeanensis]